MSERISRLFARLAASSGRPLDLLGLGECSLDRVLRVPGRLAELAPLFADPLRGGKLSAKSLDIVGGGQVATALCAAARLGCRTAFAGVVGDDSDGREVLAGLHAEGVETAATIVGPGLPTRSALVLVDEHGDRVVLEHRHPDLVAARGAVAPALLSQARIVHVDATFPTAAKQVLRDGQAAGALTSLDLDGDTREAVALLHEADLAVVAASVPLRLCGGPDVEAATLALARQIPAVLLVTLGEAGSLLAIPDGAGARLHHQAAYRAESVGVQPDSTACGDTYRAALLAALLDASTAMEDTPLDRLTSAMQQGSAAAALKCRDLGRRGCPSRAELTAFLASPQTTQVGLGGSSNQ